MNVLHLTPHLGGGVGRALSAVASLVNNGATHTFICIERPEKTQFVDAIRASGSVVLIAPSREEIIRQLETADIVQLEWWCHPATLACLNLMPELSMRLVVWCHVSGLYNEVIPEKLLSAASRFLLTSPCSYKSAEMQQLSEIKQKSISVIYSNGGFESWPTSKACNESSELAVGYIGSLNFSKLHPDYVDFVASVPIDDFQVKIVGDIQNQHSLNMQTMRVNKPELLDFVGYTEDVTSELSTINVLAYLQNPTHYGTNENALLEAMAMGIVPVVLNNPAEKEIVEHGVTGLIVNDSNEFSKAIVWLNEHPYERTILGLNAAEKIKEKHTREKLEDAFSAHYRSMKLEEKQKINFSNFFGDKPADWFLSCRKDKTIFTEDGGVNLPDDKASHFALLENSKGSASHFHRYFPNDTKLEMWAKQLAS